MRPPTIRVTLTDRHGGVCQHDARRGGITDNGKLVYTVLDHNGPPPVTIHVDGQPPHCQLVIDAFPE